MFCSLHFSILLVGHLPIVDFSAVGSSHLSNEKIRFQSFFMLITTQPFCMAWS